MQTLSQGQKKVTIFWYLVWVARLVTMKSIDRPTISGFFGPVERVTTEFCCIFSLYYVMEHEWLWASNGQKRKTWTSPERTVYCQSCDYRLTTRVKTLASLPKERGRVWPELGHTDVRASLLLSSPQQLLLLLVDQQRPHFFFRLPICIQRLLQDAFRIFFFPDIIKVSSILTLNDLRLLCVLRLTVCVFNLVIMIWRRGPRAQAWMISLRVLSCFCFEKCSQDYFQMKKEIK